jgi:FixJ family two-component response regulator
MQTTERQIAAIIDDDEAVRLSLTLLIETLGVEVRGYASARAFLDDVSHADADCLVLDVRMPGMSGLELQSRLEEEDWLAPIIFISGHADVSTAVQAMRAGAVDFLQKPFSDQALLDRVQQALEQGLMLRRRAIERGVLEARLGLLSPREREVMRRVVFGQMNKVMAEELAISVKTVEDHRASIMRKMRAKSVQELVRMMNGIDLS